MVRRVRVFKRNDRGFHTYGRPITDTNGGRLEVYESSAVSVGSKGGPFVWLAIDASAWDHSKECGIAHAHMTMQQVDALVDRLQTWQDEVRRGR